MPAIVAESVTSSAVWALLLAVIAVVCLLRSRRVVENTTLVGPWGWLITSIVVMVCANVIVLLVERSTDTQPVVWKMPVLFAAAATSFCPLISLLGAKRPQDRGWHFIVGTLWAILILPVAESLVLRHGQMPDVAGARSWFMLILIAVGIINSLPTRFWLAGLIFAAGQVAMLAASLPIVRDRVDQSTPLAGLALCSLGVIIAAMLALRRHHVPSSLDSAWLDFRDRFGLLWGLRVAEQVNVAARTAEWPFSLRWRGFVDDEGDSLDANSLSADTRQALEQVLNNLLRRFVSADWIASRTPEDID